MKPLLFMVPLSGFSSCRLHDFTFICWQTKGEIKFVGSSPNKVTLKEQISAGLTVFFAVILNVL